MSLDHQVQVNDTPRSSAADPYRASISPLHHPAQLSPSSTEYAAPQDDFDYLRKGRHRRSSDTLEALWKDAQIYEGSLHLSCPSLRPDSLRAHSHRRRPSPETVGTGSAVGTTLVPRKLFLGTPPQPPSVLAEDGVQAEGAAISGANSFPGSLPVFRT